MSGRKNSEKGEFETLPKQKSSKEKELKKSSNFFMSSPRERFRKPKDLPDAPYLSGEFKCKGTKRFLTLEEGKFIVFAKQGGARLLEPVVFDITLEQKGNILVFTDTQGVMQFEAKKAKLVSEFVTVAEAHRRYLDKNPAALLKSPGQRLKAKVAKKSHSSRDRDSPLVPSPKTSTSPKQKKNSKGQEEESWGTKSEGSLPSTSSQDSTPPSSSYETKTEDILASSSKDGSSSSSSS